MTDTDRGEQVLYPAATGLEKAMANVDADRLTDINAELVRDQWDAYAISTANLPYLAWAKGVNLWDDDWSDNFRRWWVKNNWETLSLRGTPAGLRRYVSAVGGELKRVVRPPATTYLMRSNTPEENAAFLARWPQLRIYPFVPRSQLPWNAFVSSTFGENKNGHFLDSTYPTDGIAGNSTTRTAIFWRNGVETQLTVRQIKTVPVHGNTMIVYDEVVLPGERDLGGTFLDAKPRAREFLGGVNKPERIIRVPREGSGDYHTYQAQYVTVSPGFAPIRLEPEHVAEHHIMRPLPPKSIFLDKGFVAGFTVPSIAWQYIYERWYLFDPDLAPEYRRTSTFLNHTRLGIQPYTAEAKIKITTRIRPLYAQRFVRGFLQGNDHRMVDKTMLAVRQSAALRDTIMVDMHVTRPIRLSDRIKADGSHHVGELIQS